MQIVHESSLINDFITLSMGVASMIPDSQSSPHTLVATADRALYHAKAQGRDRVVYNSFYL